MRFLLALTCALAAALTGCAGLHDNNQAAAGATHDAADATPQDPTLRRFAELDANRDSRLSLLEVALDPVVEPRFELADADHDGKLSPAEFQAFFSRLTVSGTTQLPRR